MDLEMGNILSSILQKIALPAAGAGVVAATWATACALVHNASILEALYNHGESGSALAKIEFLWLNKCAQAKHVMEITIDSTGTGAESDKLHIPLYGFPMGQLTQGVTSVQVKPRLQLLFLIYRPLAQAQGALETLTQRIDQVVAGGGILAEDKPASVAASATWQWQAWNLWKGYQYPATGRIEVVNKRGHNLRY
jgi:hypothetical protein